VRRSDPWCSGPTCQPVTLEIAGSNPVGSATKSASIRRPVRPPERGVSSSGRVGARPVPSAYGRMVVRASILRPVIGSIGSRLRLVLRQPGLARAVGVADSSDLPEVEFVAYSTSERLSGRIRLDAARITDMLNTHREYVLVDALAERLPEGGSM